MKNSYLNGRNDLNDSCLHCGLQVTPEGHDGCIGTLGNGVMNACCGHGSIDMAYIQFDHEDYKSDPNKLRIEGQEALNYIKAEAEKLIE